MRDGVRRPSQVVDTDRGAVGKMLSWASYLFLRSLTAQPTSPRCALARHQGVLRSSMQLLSTSHMLWQGWDRARGQRAVGECCSAGDEQRQAYPSRLDCNTSKHTHNHTHLHTTLPQATHNTTPLLLDELPPASCARKQWTMVL